jgi:hypothetical protein
MYTYMILEYYVVLSASIQLVYSATAVFLVYIAEATVACTLINHPELATLVYTQAHVVY